MATKRIRISFMSNGEGTLTCGRVGYQCLGKPGMRYPIDLTVTPSNKFRIKYSSEYVTETPNGGTTPAEMPWAILIWGQRGVYIHGWPGSPTLAGNGGPSSGCIHLSYTDAPKVFAYVDGRTRVTISYPW